MTRHNRLKALLTLCALLLTLPLLPLSADDDDTCPLELSDWVSRPDTWAVNSLMLGAQFYDQPTLIALMLISSPTDASVQLAAQLAAAKLNIASGVDPTPVASAVINADALLASYPGRLPYNVDSASPAGQAMLSVAATLNGFNLGQQTPGCNVTATPTGTLTPTVTATLTPTGTITPSATMTATATATPGTGPVTIIIEGPVQEININICSDPKKLDTKVPVLILALVLAAASTSLPQIRQA